MRITVQTGTGTTPVTTVLGDDAAKAFISGWLPSRASQRQEAARVRASAMVVMDRGNTKTDFSFVTERAHASYEEALKFIRDHFLAVPKNGQVQVSQSGGTTGFTLFLADACIDLRLIWHQGVSTKIQYDVAGGEFQGATPAP